nr:uncharacterized protein LOC109149214 [Ipomoea trifida]
MKFSGEFLVEMWVYACNPHVVFVICFVTKRTPIAALLYRIFAARMTAKKSAAAKLYCRSSPQPQPEAMKLITK